MTKWECSVCGYIYNLEKGDGISGIAPGTPFKNSRKIGFARHVVPTKKHLRK